MITLKKNWTYPILRQNFASNNEFHYNLKELLVNSPGGNWTVHSSATETNHGPVDYWTSPSAIRTSSISSIKPWITLTFDDSEVRFYMTIIYFTTSGSNFRIYTHHNEVPFGGTSAIEPQSSDRRDAGVFTTGNNDATMSISQDGKHFRVFSPSRHLFFGLEDDLPFADAAKFTYVIDESDENGSMNFLNHLDKGSNYLSMDRVLLESVDISTSYGPETVITQAFYNASGDGFSRNPGILPPDLYSVITPTPTFDTLSSAGTKQLVILRQRLATPIPSSF